MFRAVLSASTRQHDDGDRLRDLVTGGPTTRQAAALLMRDNAVRRVLVCDDERALGIVSIGDLAEQIDPDRSSADQQGDTQQLKSLWVGWYR
jgi:CBS domain-containing protein